MNSAVLRQDHDAGEARDNAGAGRLPEFVLVGAMKSGTTTLHEYLARHPRVFLATPKEPQFFSRDEVFARGPGWYRTLFSGARPEQLCGEASTCYTRKLEFPRAAERLAQHLPQARLVYLLRHPVERAYSHYGHLMSERLAKTGEPACSFEQALEQFPTIVDSSRYADQLAHLRRWYPESQVLVLLLDDLKRDPCSVLARVQQFLELPPADLLADGPARANESGTSLARKEARDVSRRLRTLPLVGWLKRWLPAAWRRRLRDAAFDYALRSDAIREAQAQFRQSLSPLTPITRVALLERFRDSTTEIADRLKRDLSDWQR
ncbi:MAG: sulfotransferase [Parvularculaceae bacterium]|nr:sulfotransferase [Parvularculaceae bacterium]